MKRKIQNLFSTPVSKAGRTTFGSNKKSTMSAAAKSGTLSGGSARSRHEPAKAVPAKAKTQTKSKYGPLKKSVKNAISSFVQTRNESGRAKISASQLYSSTINNPLRTVAQRKLVRGRGNKAASSQKGSFATPPEAVKPVVQEEPLIEEGGVKDGEVERLKASVAGSVGAPLSQNQGSTAIDDGCVSKVERGTGALEYVITSEDHIDENDEQVYSIQERLKYYEEKVEQIEDERQRKERENLELRMCINKLTNELTEKESKIKYFSKLQIDDPSAPVVSSWLACCVGGGR